MEARLTGRGAVGRGGGGVSGGTILSPWLVLPVAAVMMLVVAAHIGVTEQRTTPPSRRRIRIANGWVMLLAIPLLAIGFGVVATGNHRVFAMVWMAAIALVSFSVMLAFADMVNTLRIVRAERRRCAREAARRLADELRRARSTAAHEERP